MRWRALLDTLKPHASGFGFAGKFYCHKGVPIDLSKGPGNFRFPQKPVLMNGDPIRLADGTVAHGAFNLPATLIVLGVAALLVKGVKESATANAVLVGVKVLVLIVFVAACARFVRA